MNVVGKKWLTGNTVSLAALVLLLAVLLCVQALGGKFMPANAPGKSAGVVEAESGDAQVDANTDFFKDFRAQRETARTDEIALLNTIVDRPGAPEESVREADARKVEITRNMEAERAIEKLLMAKGFEDAAAFVDGDCLSVVVRTPKLTDADTAKVLDVAMHKTGLPAAKIKIIPVQ